MGATRAVEDSNPSVIQVLPHWAFLLARRQGCRKGVVSASLPLSGHPWPGHWWQARGTQKKGCKGPGSRGRTGDT